MAIDTVKMVAATGKKVGRSDLKQEEILQAVVTADNFNDRFAPITKEHPWVLMPLVHRPLIDYTLQYLSNEGVQETFVLCRSHADKIRDYIKESKWSDAESKMSVNVLSSEDYLSVGDMIRDLDAKALIRSDFVLLDGATVANVPLRPIIEEHSCVPLAKARSKTVMCSFMFPPVSTLTELLPVFSIVVCNGISI
ncbi:hypothetical protein HPB51_022391 [Rhipicephalus microplus]|uniref:Nucleotidyl transferase domain-containing protein n=1 Tax=Rhipicephalus microplus TaxID=6941 RepID=A0A9J6DR15_RHIMP|nr:hypothetical protein HPB51_022391 [Rhipicephalus microplus]